MDPAPATSRWLAFASLSVIYFVISAGAFSSLGVALPAMVTELKWTWEEAGWGYTLLGVWAVGAILLAIFPTDVPATPVSWHGAIHLVVALIAFAGGGLGAFLLSRQVDRSAATRGARRVASALGSLSLLLLVVELLSPFILPHLTSRFGGLIERLFLGSVLVEPAAPATAG